MQYSTYRATFFDFTYQTKHGPAFGRMKTSQNNSQNISPFHTLQVGKLKMLII